MLNLSWDDVLLRSFALWDSLPTGLHSIYGVPRDGIHAALALHAISLGKALLVENPKSASVFIDDVLDSGATRDHFAKHFPERPFLVLVDKQKEKINEWVSFPWSRMPHPFAKDEDGPQENIRRILQYIGEDCTREGLKETPDRVVRSYSELFAGYKQDPADVFKVFEDGACDEMVLLKNVELTSFCEHHMLPFVGRAHVAYIPDGKVIGVSKLARLVDVFARRLQIQERLTVQVTKALDEHLKPKGSACLIEAKHYCMACRGVQKQHSEMVTSSLTGVFRNIEVRQELLSLIHG